MAGSVADWSLTIELYLENVFGTVLQEDLDRGDIPKFNAFEEGIGPLEMIRISIGLEGRKNVVFLNAIYVKEGCPPHQSLLQQLESILHRIENKFTRELFAFQCFFVFP